MGCCCSTPNKRRRRRNKRQKVIRVEGDSGFSDLGGGNEPPERKASTRRTRKNSVIPGKEEPNHNPLEIDIEANDQSSRLSSLSISEDDPAFRPDTYELRSVQNILKDASADDVAQWRDIYFSDPYSSRIKYKALDQWIDEIGTVPRPVSTIVSSTLEAEHGRLTAKRLATNHRLLLQIDHRTKAGKNPTATDTLTNSSELQTSSTFEEDGRRFSEDFRRMSRQSNRSNRIDRDQEEGNEHIDFISELVEEERRDSMVSSSSSSFEGSDSQESF